MVVVLAQAVDNICESLPHNPITRSHIKTTSLYLIGIHKEFSANVRKFESDFEGGQHGCTCVSMGNKQYAFHSHIVFIRPRKPG